jgi:hypothetical protein
MLLDLRDEIPFVLLLIIYICYRSQICQPSACFAYWLEGFPHSENWDSDTNCMRIISHCHTCFMAFWIPFYVLSLKKLTNEMQESSHSLSNVVHGCWRLLIVVMTLHMFSLPMEKINCITDIKNRWRDEMAEHSIVFAVEFFQSINISRLISYSFVVGLCSESKS